MNKEIETQVGRNVKAVREEAGMTQGTLAAKLQLCGCDITRSAVAKIEVGQRHLYPDEILLIKEILDVSFDEIFYGPEEKEEEKEDGMEDNSEENTDSEWV